MNTSAADSPVGRLQMSREGGGPHVGSGPTALPRVTVSTQSHVAEERLDIALDILREGGYGGDIISSFRTNVRVTARETGLPKDTVFLCFQIRALDPSRFRDPRTGLLAPAGQLPPIRMVEVDAALRAVLSL